MVEIGLPAQPSGPHIEGARLAHAGMNSTTLGKRGDVARDNGVRRLTYFVCPDGEDASHAKKTGRDLRPAVNIEEAMWSEAGATHEGFAVERPVPRSNSVISSCPPMFS
jgi:hypothetical protein